MSPTIRELFDSGDHQSLLIILRRHPDPKFRTEAARLLPSLQELDSVEGLIRSALDDADPDVRSASRTALHQYLGKAEAEMAISAYGEVEGVMPYEVDNPIHEIEPAEETDSGSDFTFLDEDDSEAEPEDDEIIDAKVPPDFLDFSAEEKVFHWDPEHITSLILILENDDHPDRQLKALRILASNPTPAGIDALSMVALWSENRLVKKAAYKALEFQYGEDTDRLLEEFRAAHLDIGVDEDELEEDEILVEVDPEEFRQQQPVRSQFSQPMATDTEGLSGAKLVWVLGALLILAAILIYWFFLK